MTDRGAASPPPPWENDYSFHSGRLTTHGSDMGLASARVPRLAPSLAAAFLLSSFRDRVNGRSRTRTAVVLTRTRLGPGYLIALFCSAFQPGEPDRETALPFLTSCRPSIFVRTVHVLP
jgi:hypothetical protein